MAVLRHIFIRSHRGLDGKTPAEVAGMYILKSNVQIGTGWAHGA